MAVAPLPKVEHEPSALCGYPKGAVNEVSLENFKRALTRWETGKVIENPSRASPLYKDLSNDTIFCRIHLAGQHL
jgi:hypothetical protein